MENETNDNGMRNEPLRRGEWFGRSNNDEIRRAAMEICSTLENDDPANDFFFIFIFIMAVFGTDYLSRFLFLRKAKLFLYVR